MQWFSSGKQQRNRAQPEHAERVTESSVAKECNAALADGVDKLATNQARDVNLVEVRSVGQSELLSACEVLGGRTLRISREKECDLLKSDGCARAAELLRDNCPTAGWFRVPCGLW